LWRRSILTATFRAGQRLIASLTTLDCPDPSHLTAKRLTTTTPAAITALYNNDFMLRQSRLLFAERIESEAARTQLEQVNERFN